MPTGLPARHATTFTPDLTAEVALARSRKQMRSQGGLALTPDQQRAHDLALIDVSRSDKPQLSDRPLPFHAVYGYPTLKPPPQEATPPPPPPVTDKLPRGPRTGTAAYYEKQPKGTGLAGLGMDLADLPREQLGRTVSTFDRAAGFPPRGRSTRPSASATRATPGRRPAHATGHGLPAGLRPPARGSRQGASTPGSRRPRLRSASSTRPTCPTSGSGSSRREAIVGGISAVARTPRSRRGHRAGC